MKTSGSLLIILSLTIFFSCNAEDAEKETYSSKLYSDMSMWLCGPDDVDHDYCLDNIDSTEILQDNTRQLVKHEAAVNPDYDCFYIYPTVDLTGAVGQHTDFSDINPMLDPLMSQAARLTKYCRVYAPLYKQITIPTFMEEDEILEEYLAKAYEDIEDAFKHYMGQYNKGRPFIIAGHSQGSRMATFLLQNLFDDDPQMREKFVLGLLIGGNVTVKKGELTGGSFQNIPACSDKEESGCVVGYRSFSAIVGAPEDTGDSELVSICVNPGTPGTLDKIKVASAYFPTIMRQAYFGSTFEDFAEDEGIDSAFIHYKNMYTAQCVEQASGNKYMEINVQQDAGDLRDDIIDYDYFLYSSTTGLKLGFHVVDYNFLMGDILKLVENKIKIFEAGK